MGTIERKAIVAAQQWARKLSIRLRESRGRKEQKRKLQNSRKTIKMAISAYVSVIMLNANSLIKRHRVVSRETHLSAAHKRLISDAGSQSEREGLGRDISCRREPRGSWGSPAYLEQTRLFKKGCNQRQIRALHNDKGVDPVIRYDVCKEVCTQHVSTKYINIHKCKERDWQQNDYSRGH